MVNEMSIITHSAEQTAKLGVQLGKLLAAGDVVLLSGELGSGKTTFTQGIARGLGVDDPVTSPTFTLVAEYEGRVPLAHMDLYRLYEDHPGDPGAVWRAVESLGFDDYAEGHHVVLVEWPEAVKDQWDDVLQIDIRKAPLPRLDEREFHCVATGSRSWERLDEWVKQWLF